MRPGLAVRGISTLLALTVLVACHIAPPPAQAAACSDATELIAFLTAASEYPVDVLFQIRTRLIQDARRLRSVGDPLTASIAEDLADAVGSFAAHFNRPQTPEWPKIKDLVNRLPSCPVEVT